MPWYVLQFTREYPAFARAYCAMHMQITIHVYWVTWQWYTWYWANCNVARFGEPSQLWKTFLLTSKYRKHDATPFWKWTSPYYWHARDRNATKRCGYAFWCSSEHHIHSGDVKLIGSITDHPFSERPHVTSHHVDKISSPIQWGSTVCYCLQCVSMSR